MVISDHFYFFTKIKIMSTIITALCVLGFIALIVGILMFVHKRDQKTEAAKKSNMP